MAARTSAVACVLLLLLLLRLQLSYPIPPFRRAFSLGTCLPAAVGVTGAGRRSPMAAVGSGMGRRAGG
ncbi:uncharacterized protein K452DRAFT_282469 [Aplosporella prunicola CBS 121167]|uniref:Uncharacterized protein n=1 Tax=Aplosporella prunicola CBS 121167 TaxID=1176127 RepID=A0A6A6BUH2_9PEZI|nr:uncharacterized protein K452DRAFT_282469 [Aplosporella prunicola CBS 121167]KAF2147468.1 hypothetical protein K452DRAFT_282469 [Aplosporella prunicola CBS 121167]